MTEATLVFLIREDEILLTYKKRGFGMGKWNGAGGKVENETIKDAAIREVKEEVGVIVQEIDHVATISFYNAGVFDWRVHVFLCWQFIGIPKEGDEVRPKWFKLEEIPYDNMWEDDRYWLPRVLTGEKVEGEFYYSEGLEKLQSYDLRKSNTES
ncbi:MAG: 8-oxo-dGTP diphosphatase [Candidatus Heimdallarchaeota archaeon]|nr:8-oxo-dGTP diphosphatase [Candidatus Heimdallarchaeota archaeon]MDH5645432.1 8-oxo-dGTP diphosphatase [Candidatus Heimdallarchaeota archaeon]